jgi:cysteine-rich repeat protein
MRISFVSLLAVISLFCTLEACGGGDGGGHASKDDGGFLDEAGSNSSPAPDAGSSTDASAGADAGGPDDAGQSRDAGKPIHGGHSHDAGATMDSGSSDDGSGGSGSSVMCGNQIIEKGEKCDDGNTLSGDGCSSTCHIEGEIVACQTLAAGPCTVTAGDGARVLVGTVLTPTKIYRGGQVVLDTQGAILQVGCKPACDADSDCAAVASSATAVTCPSGVISPGLINTHDQITYTQNSPYNDTGERYEHRHDWRKGLGGHTKISTSAGATADEISWGELRFVLGGATSTVGSGGQTGLLRNLDRANMEEGLGQRAVDFDSFPLNDSTPPVGFPGAVACGTFSGVVADTDLTLVAADAYEAHVAEGINAYASNEFVCLSAQNPGHDVLLDKSAIMGGVGLTASQFAAMGASGTALIWSPRSNLSLYGATATVTAAARMGVAIALGTDWMPTGSMNLLRELRCADSYNQAYLGGFFSDRQLWLMVTARAAEVTATDDVIGTLAKGKVGDIAVFDGSTHADYRAVIDAEPQDVQLVMRAGKVLYGDESIVSSVPNAGSCDALDVCGTQKSVCLQGEIGTSLSGLQNAVPDIYAAFFCGAPSGEPSCVPARPVAVNGSTIYTGAITVSDSDGDGIADAQDDCPEVFDPVRPVDNGVQPDFDADGAGDACDACPLNANTTSCSTPDPDDGDGDGVANAEDNCPNIQNQAQTDTDADAKGDACDACPIDSNPGSAPCPETIYAVKGGTVAPGTLVALTDRLVTARNAQGFFLQVSPNDSDYAGADDSGIYVFDPANTVAAGDRVTITSALVENSGGHIQLTQTVAMVVTSLGEAPPAPVSVLVADVATGGARAAALDGVIVQVMNATVTNIDPPLESGDTAPSHEFVVDDVLRVDDLLYLTAPFPVLGQNFASVAGVLDFVLGDAKLEPREAADVVPGLPSLAEFAPAQSYIDVGQMAVPTIPTALTVTLTNAPTTDTFVTIESGDPLSLTVVGGGVTVGAGQTSAEVLLNGLAQSPNVTLTASLGASAAMLIANVRVIGAAEQPSVVSLTPSTSMPVTGDTVTLTVTLDIPAPAGGTSVTLTLEPSDAGTIPMAVLVPANTLSASFDYGDASKASSVMVTATLDASMASASLTIGAVGCAATGLLISEIRSRGDGGASDEFIELYNPTTSPVTLDSTWKVEARSNAASSYTSRWTGTGKTIPAHGHFLIASAGYTQSPAADEALSTGLTDAMSVRLSHSGTVVDAICFAFDVTSMMPFTAAGTTYTCEGTLVTNPHNNTTVTSTDASIERKPGGAAGNCVDTNDSAADFATLAPANAQSSASPSTP